METSILISTKKILGVPEDYTVFDHDIVTHINSTFSILAQLGVGPADGFMIEGPDETWDQFMPEQDPQFNNVKTYVYLQTRAYFDPPTTSYMIAAMERQIEELVWRMNVHREETQWTDPNPEVVRE